MKRIQTRVSADLTKYTDNFFFGMSMRQTLLSAAGTAVTAGIYIFSGLPGIVSILAGLPLFALAFLKPDGLAAEVYVWNWLRFRLIRPKVRVYDPANELYDLLWHDRLLGRPLPRRYAGKEKTTEHKNKHSGRTRHPRDETGRSHAQQR